MKLKYLIVLIVFSLSLIITEYAQSEPKLFASVVNPTGVITDQSGSVYVQSLSLPEFGGGLLKFDANGNLIAQNNQLSGKFRFAPDPLHGVIWAQEINGDLYYINPDTLQAQLLINLKTWTINNHHQEQVFNILNQRPDILLMISPTFGDITTRQVGADQLDIFISGLTSSGSGIPFVLRLRIKNQTIEGSIVAASIPVPTTILPPPLDSYPYGIAVNSRGTVLTVLPEKIDPDNGINVTQLFLASFGADFPEIGNAPPVFTQPYKQNSNQVFAIGMTPSNKDDGFYVATVANGFGCGAGPAILYFPPTLDNVICIADLSILGLGNVEPSDIAIDPNNQFLYVTMPQNGLVLRLDLP